MRQLASKAWQFVNVSWQMIGMTVLLCVLAECGYRAQASVREQLGGGVQHSYTDGDPQSRLPWHAQFVKEYDEARVLRWKSYVYWTRLPSGSNRYVNVDSAGHRVTPQPTVPEVPVARVFTFGGSTMWGTSQRDSATIAAELARRLQALAGAGQRIEVVNYGENGFVNTQDLIALELALRSGARPDVVVMYDGINDVGTVVQHGVAGLPQNEGKRIRDFAFGRAVDRSGFARGWQKDSRAVAMLAGEFFNQSDLLEWVQTLKKGPAPTYIAADSAARSAVRVYVENARLVEALARSYGFTPIFVWQPTPQSTPKPLTGFEQRLLKSTMQDPYWRRIKETHALVPALLNPAMASAAPGHFVDESTLFTGDTMSVFTDRIGHSTETSVPVIVDAFWPLVRRAIEARLATGKGARR